MNKILQRISLPVFIMYVFACLTKNDFLQEYLKPLAWVTVIVGFIRLLHQKIQNNSEYSGFIYMLTGIKTDIVVAFILTKVLLTGFLMKDDKEIKDEGILFCITVLCIYGLFFDIIGIYKL